MFFDLVFQVDSQTLFADSDFIFEAPACEQTSKFLDLVYPTRPLSSSAGRIRQYAICYDCGSNDTEIVKLLKCVVCGAQKRSLLMVACQETWPPRAERVGQKCFRCSCAQPDRSSLQLAIYTITCSSQSWGNRPVCFHCYGVPVARRRGSTFLLANS